MNSESSNAPNYRNPLFTKKNWQAFVIEKISLFAWLAILIFFSIIYVLFYSPWLQIKIINISGIDNKNAKIIENKFIKWQIQQSKFLIFKQSNILLFDKNWLKKNISSQYDPQSVTVKKKLPDTLTVTIEEKKPILILQSANNYFYLEGNGNISSKIDQKEQAIGLPLIIDESPSAVVPGQKIMDKNEITAIMEIISNIIAINKFTVTSYSLPPASATASAPQTNSSVSRQFNVHTDAGYAIYFDLTKDVSTQINKLIRVLDEKAGVAPANEYIDLRIGDRVYLK
ncbi:MAG: FtsQ-type POTRA domain-containing protein [Patescibacteria group bacterium]